MDGRSVFFDEWLNSLREQYKHVVRINDRVTLPSLTIVMQQVGFSEAELTQLRLGATMRADEVADDFVPDLTQLDAARPGQAHPAECLCPQCVAIDESAFDDEGQPLAIHPEESAREAGGIFPVAEPASPSPDADAEPMTFEDSMEASSAADEVDPADDSQDAEPDDEAADPNAPQQISLF